MNIIGTLFKMIHWPLCRAYARLLNDRPADAFLAWLCKFQFYRVYRFWPDFIHPIRFSEKLWNRMLYDRNPLLTLISDKLRVREYVRQRAGSECLIPLLWQGPDPERIPFSALPNQFVVKTNHGCGYNIIVTDGRSVDQQMIIRRLSKWLDQNFCTDKYLGIGWGYKNINPTVLVETFIGHNNKSPIDYKFYCFNGKVEIIAAHFDRFNTHKTLAFSRDFRPYGHQRFLRELSSQAEPPVNALEMVSLAETLSTGFEFLRVDLYAAQEKVYFGELTPYPAGVSSFRALDIGTMDHILGQKWKIQ